ncbi:MAG TPA: flagellar hook assembly protein FlgD [Burkholderiales bacterium]|nr:flagellar hook assembly protein FlgD [Burkholderiales bacterium]
MTAAVQNTGVDLTSLTPQKSATKSETSASEDRFLKLLVTQLKNQDPLNPMDNAQMTTQLAQISTVSGIEKLNGTLQSLAASFGATQALQATSMLGQGVLIPGSALTLQGGSAVGGVTLSGPADKVIVSISDANGVLLDKVDIGPHPAGVANFSWDGSTDEGTAAEGRYAFSVAAVRGDAKVETSPLAYGRVTAVAPSASGASVTVGDLGTVALGDVKQIVQ